MSKTSVSLSQPAYDYVLDLIMSKKLMPGEHVPELKIAKEFGISRTPVRDAMRQLANDGLITIYPNRFAEVTEYTADAIRDIGLVRIALDTMGVKLASLYGSQADFLALKELAQRCKDAGEAGDGKLRIKYDLDFHLELMKLSRNDMIVKYQKELSLRIQFVIVHHPNMVQVEQNQIQQHFDIADALLERDVATAQGIILDHLTTYYNLKGQFPKGFFNDMEL